MSHFVNDQIVDNIISDVADMSDHDVKKALFDAGKRVLPADMDAKRDMLIDQIWNDMVDMGGPHG